MSMACRVSVTAPTTVICHRYPADSPILGIWDAPTDLSITARHTDPAVAETFARDLLAAAQKFYDATVERNARIAKTAEAPVRRLPLAIDPPDCGCTECLTGEYVPLDRARPEHVAAMLDGKIANNTGETVGAIRAVTR